ncbi:hypothetical protein CCHR01_18359 [Colletotrichum chrysophilum]|uniref:Uncharacterized protein n=1 Tax=Colletotrichum chrysophilum TaxID=1836956 RepID=A0AAD9A094_9PEZI|nr:hypothetical protein CCHR01_18359 [Colletotrichum chrysophilum]
MPSPQTRQRGRTDDVHPTTPDGTARQPQPTGLPPPNAGNPISTARPRHVQDPPYPEGQQEKLRPMQCRSAALRASIIRRPIWPSGGPSAAGVGFQRQSSHAQTYGEERQRERRAETFCEILVLANNEQLRCGGGAGSSSPPPRSLLSWPT